MKKRLVGFCLTATVALAAVSSAQKSANTDYYPMRPGSVWTYDTKVGGTQLRQTATVTKRAKTAVGEEATIEWRANDRVVQTEVYRITSAALIRLEGGGGGGRIEPPMPVFKYPAKSGSKWTWQGTVKAMGMTMHGKNNTVITGPTTIKTPAGTFQKVLCIHSTGQLTLPAPQKSSHRSAETATIPAGWQAKSPAQAGPQTVTYVSDMWLAPGVGPVQQKFVLGPQTIEGHLVSYKLK